MTTAMMLRHIAEGTDDQSWQASANCLGVDPDLFFPVGTTGPAIEQIENAKAVCMECEARQPCLEFALTNDERFGIWGGLSERERRRLRLMRRDAISA